MATANALREVERLARELADRVDRRHDDYSEAKRRANDVDQDSVSAMQDTLDFVAALELVDEARDLRLALVQLDLARAADSERMAKGERHDPMFGVEVK